jgi:competence protein ComEC
MNRWTLKRKVHISWLIAIACLGIFAGVFFAQYIRVEFFSTLACLAISIIILTIGLWRKYVYLIPFVILGGVLLGLWRGSISQDELTQFQPLYGKLIVIEGSVKDDIDTSTLGQIVIRMDGLDMKGKSLPGTLYITSTSSDIKRGDKLVLHGKLQTGFGSFSGVIYRATIDKIIHPKPGDIARVARDWFSEGVRKAIPEPESSLGIGYLVGQRRSLPLDLIAALQLAGLTHIVVASGYNLTILVRLARRLFAKLSKYLSTLLSGGMILGFMAVTGVSPSMSRAGLVAGLSLLAWYYGRKFHPVVLLSIAIAVTLFINPGYAWGDLGWQLSFAAFAGVMILAPLAQRYFFGDKKLGTFQQILGETISAQIATAPIIIMTFGQIPNVGILSNLLVLPLVPLGMLLTFIAGLGGLIAPAFAIIIGLPATLLLKYSVGTIDFFASLPWATTKINLAWWGVVVCYLVIISVCVLMWRVTKYNLRDVNLVE